MNRLAIMLDKPFVFSGTALPTRKPEQRAALQGSRNKREGRYVGKPLFRHARFKHAEKLPLEELQMKYFRKAMEQFTRSQA